MDCGARVSAGVYITYEWGSRESPELITRAVVNGKKAALVTGGSCLDGP